MTDDAAYERGLVDGFEALRARARGAWARDDVSAALVAILCLGGAGVFLVSPQITRTVCRMTGDARVCDAQTVEFNGWAYWVIGAAVCFSLLMAVRHLKGVRRASPLRWSQRALAVVALGAAAGLFAGYQVSSLGGAQKPFVFPAVAAAAVALLAARRGDWLPCGGALALAGVIVVAGMRAEIAFGPQWWFARNAGYALSAGAVSVVATLIAWRWHRRQPA